MNAISVSGDTGAPSCCKDGFYRVFAEFDPKRKTVSVNQDHPSTNTTPFSVYHGRVIRFSAQTGVDLGDVTDALETEEIRTSLEKLSNCYEERWNGQNHVGEFKADDAESLIDSIRNKMLTIEPRWSAMSASDWIASERLSIVRNAADHGVKKEAEDCKAAAASENILLIGSCEEQIQEWLDEAVRDLLCSVCDKVNIREPEGDLDEWAKDENQEIEVYSKIMIAAARKLKRDDCLAAARKLESLL